MAIVAIFLGLIVLNLLGLYAEQRFSLTADMTPQKLYTVSPETRELLDSLEEEVSIYTTYTPASRDEAVEALVENYNNVSSKVHWEKILTEKSKPFLAQFDTAGTGIQDGSVIIANKDHSRFRILKPGELYVVSDEYTRVASRAESRITSAIRYVATGEGLRACVLTGHNEIELSSLSALQGMLESLNYQVVSYDLLRAQKELDPHMDVLFILSPKNDISGAELEMLRAYLSQGGKIVACLDSVYYEDGELRRVVRKRDNLMALFEGYGLAMKQDLLVSYAPEDTSLRSTALLMEVGDTPATKALQEAGGRVVMTEAASLYATGKPGVEIIPLVYSPDSCCALEGEQAVKSLAVPADVPRKAFMTGVYAKREEGELILFSTSSLVQNDGLSISGNGTLLTGCLDYLTQDRQVLRTQEKPLTVGEMEDLTDQQQSLLTVLLVIMLPMACMLAGIGKWSMRRRL